jgi:hypothetical protein
MDEAFDARRHPSRRVEILMLLAAIALGLLVAVTSPGFAGP